MADHDRMCGSEDIAANIHNAIDIGDRAQARISFLDDVINVEIGDGAFPEPIAQRWFVRQHVPR